MKIALYALSLLVVSAAPGLAQQAKPMPGMQMQTQDGDAAPSSKAFKQANEKMMHGMAVPLSGDADRDFVAAMIPHHQGAVEMARIELRYGKDAELRRLATNIVRSQDKEIAQMKTWQTRHAPRK